MFMPHTSAMFVPRAFTDRTNPRTKSSTSGLYGVKMITWCQMSYLHSNFVANDPNIEQSKTYGNKEEKHKHINHYHWLRCGLYLPRIENDCLVIPWSVVCAVSRVTRHTAELLHPTVMREILRRIVCFKWMPSSSPVSECTVQYMGHHIAIACNRTRMARGHQLNRKLNHLRRIFRWPRHNVSVTPYITARV